MDISILSCIALSSVTSVKVLRFSFPVTVEGLLFPASLLLRRSVFRLVEASAKREMAGCFLPALVCAHIFIERESSGYEADPLHCAKFTGGIFLL